MRYNEAMQETNTAEMDLSNMNEDNQNTTKLEISFDYLYKDNTSEGYLVITYKTYYESNITGSGNNVYHIDPRLAETINSIDKNKIKSVLSAIAKLESDAQIKYMTPNEIKKGKQPCISILIALYRHVIRTLLLILIEQDIVIRDSYTKEEIKHWNLNKNFLHKKPISTIRHFFYNDFKDNAYEELSKSYISVYENKEVEYAKIATNFLSLMFSKIFSISCNLSNVACIRL